MSTIYVVAGHPRTGSSLMMRALHFGGLDAVFDRTLDSAYARQMTCESGYDPNPGSFYECQVNVKQPGFVSKYRDKLVKILKWQVIDLPRYHYNVVMMRRSHFEIDMSMRRIGQGLGQTPRLYQGYQDRIQLILEERSDINLTVLDYRNVIDDPVATFKTLAGNGFPINPELAATVVDEKLYRNRAASDL